MAYTKKPRTQVAPADIPLDSRPTGVVTDPIGSRQATILQLATEFNDGIMSAAQAAAIANLPIPTPPGSLLFFSQTTRPAPGAVPKYSAGYNTTTNALNITDGINWYNALGELA